MLAEHEGEVISTAKMGQLLGVSPMYLRNIALELERRGCIESIRGARGGYRLTKKPKEIKISCVAELYEDLSLVPCLEDPSNCPFSGSCKARKFWEKLKKEIEELFKSKTIADIVKEKI